MADETDRVVFQEMLRPYRVALITLLPIIGTVGTYGYEVVSFINRDEAHEKQQDENLITLRRKIEGQEKAITRLRKRNLEVLQVLITDLDLLRSKQLQLLPPRERAQARKDFDAQRAKSLSLLVAAQNDP